MERKVVSWIVSCRWFVGFTAVFAALMAFVFWGTWSLDVAPVMPDDSLAHSLTRLGQVQGWWRGFLASGKFIPSDLIWQGLLFSKYWLQEFKYASAGYFAALGLAYFLRGRGLSACASYGAGLLLGFCGYWFSLFSAGHAGWFAWMTYGTFAFGLVDRAIRLGGLRRWFLFGACVAWGSFYQPDLWLLFTLLTGAYALAACAWLRRFPWKGFLAAALAFAVIGIPSAYDAFANALSGRNRQIAEATADESDGVAAREARWIFVTNWSLPIGETVEFVRSRVNGDTSCPMTLQLGRAAGKDVRPYTGALGRPYGAPAGNYRQHSLYVGWITCLLALAGGGTLLARRSAADSPQARPVVAFFLAAAFLCWLLSLGRNFEPLYRLVFMLPIGDSIRAPVKWHHLTEFCLCVLAGFGLERLLRGLGARLGAAAASAACVAVVLFGAADLAHVDRLYCAPLDLRVVRGANAAADFVAQAGKGRVLDLAEGGNGLLAWSFRAHGVGVTGDPQLGEADAPRFVWVGLRQAAEDKGLSDYLRAKARPAGHYRVTQRGVFAAQPPQANMALYQLVDAPPPPREAPWGRVRPGVLALGLLSLAGTLFAMGLAVWPACVHFWYNAQKSHR